MLQLKNNTNLSASVDCFYDQKGLDLLIITVKGSYSIDEPWQLLAEQPEPSLHDVYFDDPASSSIQQGADVSLLKPYVDIIMTGSVIAPNNQAVSELDVNLQLILPEQQRLIDKSVKVFGDRVWETGLLGLRASAPTLFKHMPIVYERAYGGMHTDKKGVHSVPQNLIGCGFGGRQSTKQLLGTALPNIEDPNGLIKTPHTHTKPVGFAWLSPSWLPRSAYAGTYDDAWQHQQAPYLPKDFDSRYLQAAPEDIICKQPLQGGEQVSMVNMSPKGVIQFFLPAVSFEVVNRFERSAERVSMNLCTLHLQPNLGCFSLVWQGGVNVNKRRLQCQEISIDHYRVKML